MARATSSATDQRRSGVFRPAGERFASGAGWGPGEAADVPARRGIRGRSCWVL